VSGGLAGANHPYRAVVRGQRRSAAALVLVLVAVAAALVLRTADAAPFSGRPSVPIADDAPTVTFIGDSWTVGRGATDLYGYAPRTADRLGRHARLLGVGGSGYSVPGPHRNVFADRIKAAVASRPEIIVVQGSLNERRSTPQALARAATATLTDLRGRADPGTRILVVGASDNPGTSDATIDWINEAIGAAAAKAGLPFVDPAAQGWLDPADPRLWADTIHPSDLGYEAFARRLVPRLQELLGV
jgi:lysophospholipase L1-like esterase